MKVRLVPTLQNDSGVLQGPPEYRVFEVKKGSVYDALGLQNADILVAADDYIIRSTIVFTEFVKLIPSRRLRRLRSAVTAFRCC